MSPLRNALYFQAGLGLLANIFLLFFYTFIILVNKSKLMDLISYIFGSLNVENDFKCKASFYIHRMMRGLSICITCLLSVFQAVTISPNTSLLIYAFFCMWFLNLSFSTKRIFFLGAFTNVSETNQMKVTKYCSLFPMNYIIMALILTETIFRDVFLIGVMLTSSAYMVIILFRHHRQCKHLHSLSHLRASPEKRATDFIVSSIAVLSWMYHPVILTIQMFVVNAYPTITPLIQITSDNRIISMLTNLWTKCHQIVK
uniref:Vomeronasal type-1 receptor n=1 Tax=Cricetulus griseus TaxID=10029 RepID=A0A8C2QPV3_CRIGR